MAPPMENENSVGRIINNIGRVEGSFIQYNAPVEQGGNEDLRRRLEECVAELRNTIVSAEQRNELSSSDSKAAQLQLTAATTRVRAAVGTDRTRLTDALRRIQDALSGGLTILAQLAAVMSAVKGL
jgi:hypothetical protein